MRLDWGREVSGDLDAAERREWLCTNGIGGFASGTVAGSLTRRYHGLLVAALAPPLGRTLLAAAVHDTLAYADTEWPLFVGRWASGAVVPEGHRLIDRFKLEGITPVWTYAVGDARLEKRIWMQPGANTTCVRWRLLRASGPVSLSIKSLVNYRDYHATTRGGDWRMDVTPIADGVRVTAFDGAGPLSLIARGAHVEPAHVWYREFELPAERARGLDHVEDHLHAATFRAELVPESTLTLVISAEPAPALDAEAVWRARVAHEATTFTRWRRAAP